MGTYDRQVATAHRLITRYGGPITILVPVIAADDADDATPWRSAGSDPREIPTVGVVFPYTGAQAVARPFSQNMLTPNVIDPQTGRDLVITREMFFRDPNGVVWSFQDARSIDPSMTQIIVWDCEVVQWPRRS